MFRTETAVRRWIARLEAPMEWVEAARGGTTGQGDVRLFCGDVWHSIELKCWELIRLHVGRSWNRDVCYKFDAKMQPTQVRYHHVMDKKGLRSLLLVGCQNGNTLHVVPGYLAPLKAACRIDAKPFKEYGDGEGEKFLDDLSKGVFWDTNIFPKRAASD